MKHPDDWSFASWVALCGALLLAAPAWAQLSSAARAVRLSFVEGDVGVRRPDVQTWAAAPVNTPLQEGFKLSTADSSFAEVQFENGGTIRLGQLSFLTFTELQLAANGSRLDHVELTQGYATFHALPSRSGETLQVDTPYATLLPQENTLFRVDLDQGLARVEVFDGTVKVQSNLGPVTLDRDAVLLLEPGTAEPTVVSRGITEDDWDQWVDDRESHAGMTPGGPTADAFMGNPGEDTYGWNDLSQYGTWSDVPGEGYGWMPNGMAMGWSPYSTGQWVWYNGWGYTWIAAEPWGWLPYHYGGWSHVPRLGWVWFPGAGKTWSPGRVTWYHGQNWVGWVPRSNSKDGAVACQSNCGGGVVSTAMFRGGGMLRARAMLPIVPTTGARVNQPTWTPMTTAKLPGPAMASNPAATRRVEPSASYESEIPTNPPTGVVPAGALPAGAGGVAKPASNPSSMPPVPVTGREPMIGREPTVGQEPGERSTANPSSPGTPESSMAKHAPGGWSTNASASKPAGGNAASGAHTASPGATAPSHPAGTWHSPGGHR